jgi:ABC-type antimicrobial peptide transport system permease subunit
MVVRQGLGLTAAGVALGLTAAAAGTRVMRGLLFEVSETDPAVLGAVAASIVLVGLAASWVPARRAARVDPVESLRAD